MAVDNKRLQILRQCCARRTPVFFSASSLEILFETRILAVREDAMVLANTVTPEFITRTVGSKKFFLQCQMLQFVSETIDSDGCNIVFPFESLKAMEETRQAERITFEPDETAVVEMINPHDKETLLTKSIMEMSTAGLSIRTPVDSNLFQAGTLFQNMRIVISGKLKRETSGRVVYQRVFLNQQGKRYCQVGFRFEDQI